MTANAIARVVSDLRNGRAGSPTGVTPELTKLTLALISEDAVVIDATALYRTFKEKDQPAYLYEDHSCIAPPFNESLVCYRNEHGNVIVMHCLVENSDERWDVEPADHEVDWSRVKWRHQAFIWLGGYSHQLDQPLPTTGPVHLLRQAIYDNGEPADLAWRKLTPSIPIEIFEVPQVVLLATLNFLNCRNVELVEPNRSRRDRRRLARLGVQVHELTLFPVGKSSRGTGNNANSGGTPLVPVRGHFARYGPEHERGLLFGKYSGRFWIAPHARGDSEYGKSRPTYRLETGKEKAESDG